MSETPDKIQLARTELERTRGETDRLRAARKLDAAVTPQAIAAARTAERAARAALRDAVVAFVADDPGASFRRLDATHPIALLPCRLETRFQPAARQLLVRVYPDEIFADAHEPGLTADERRLGDAYWAAGEPDHPPDLEAWHKLVVALGAPRAAWVARATAHGAPEPATRAESWTRAVEARLLPDRWIVVCYRAGREVRRAEGTAIHEPLALTLAPDASPDDPDVVPLPGGPTVDPDSAWLVDFDRALGVGMALVVDRLDATDLAQGFDRVIAVGVKSSLGPDEAATAFAGLLDAHHYSRGLAFVPQGTPTNNTAGGPAGYPPADPNGAVSAAVELGAPLVQPGGDDSDGARVARALGVPFELFAHVAGADRHEQDAARAMNQALWPATLGYFLEHMMDPVFSRDDRGVAWQHFTDWVRARGPLPAFRVGAVPYGILPVSSLDRWKPDAGASRIDVALPDVLRKLRPIWIDQIGNVPRTGRTTDPDRDLFTTLGLDASTREVYVRSVVGQDVQYNLSGWLGFDWVPWEDAIHLIARIALAAIGHPEWQPRLLSASFQAPAHRFRGDFVAPAPLSETAALDPNYIRALRQAGVWVMRELIPLSAAPDKPHPLLHVLLRHSGMLQYTSLASELLVDHGVIAAAEVRERELVKIVPGSEAAHTPWDRLQLTIPAVTGQRTLAEYLAPAVGEIIVPGPSSVTLYRSALQRLEDLPTAELDRLFGETLDVCAHRLDAWITSLVSKRLATLRERALGGLHLGAFAWVEGLRPDGDAGDEVAVPPLAPPVRRGDAARVAAPGDAIAIPPARRALVQRDSGGWIHAPSMPHAATAAVLRNAYLTHGQDPAGTFGIDLSSRRVRIARQLLDAVRQGQQIGAVLGYLFENGLHARALDRLIEPLRQRYPLASARRAEELDTAVEAVASRDVVDGLALRTAWQDGALVLPPVSAAERDGVDAELRALDDAADATADLLTAESVHQMVLGNTGSAAASLDAIAAAARPPDPEVARTPRTGQMVTHRVAVVVGDATLALPGWGPATPRTDAEPALDAWLGRLFGSAGDVRCVLSWTGPVAGTREVALAELGLRPLDVLALAGAPPHAGRSAELELRILHAEPTATGRTISFDPVPAWRAAGIRSFPELTELARAVLDLLDRARPLRPDDLVLPHDDAGAAAADWMAAAALARTDQAIGALTTFDDDLASATPGTLADVLRRAGLLGVTGVYPPDGAAGAELAIARDVARDEIARRLAAAAALAPAATAPARDRVTAAIRIAEAALGATTCFLPQFRPAQGAALDAALAPGATTLDDPGDPARWIAQLARVRPALDAWRGLWLRARALGGAAPAVEHGAPVIDVAQLPLDVRGRWVALTDPEAAAQVALALHRPVHPAGGVWRGLLLDQWTELIPRDEEQTAVAFHYRDPGAEAAQAVLLAVSPSPGGGRETAATHWDLETVLAIVGETLDLAKIRAVDGELLGLLAQFLPATYVAENVADDTPQAGLSRTTIASAVVSAVRSE